MLLVYILLWLEVEGYGGAVFSSGLGRFKYVRRVRFTDVSSAKWEIKDLLTECVATWGGAGAFTDDIIGPSTPLVMFLSSPSYIMFVFGFFLLSLVVALFPVSSLTPLHL